MTRIFFIIFKISHLTVSFVNLDAPTIFAFSHEVKEKP